jgi:hypothetical protein
MGSTLVSQLHLLASTAVIGAMGEELEVTIGPYEAPCHLALSQEIMVSNQFRGVTAWTRGRKNGKCIFVRGPSSKVNDAFNYALVLILENQEKKRAGTLPRTEPDNNSRKCAKTLPTKPLQLPQHALDAANTNRLYASAASKARSRASQGYSSYDGKAISGPMYVDLQRREKDGRVWPRECKQLDYASQHPQDSQPAQEGEFRDVDTDYLLGTLKTAICASAATRDYNRLIPTGVVRQPELPAQPPPWQQPAQKPAVAAQAMPSTAKAIPFKAPPPWGKLHPPAKVPLQVPLGLLQGVYVSPPGLPMTIIKTEVKQDSHLMGPSSKIWNIHEGYISYIYIYIYIYRVGLI